MAGNGRVAADSAEASRLAEPYAARTAPCSPLAALLAFSQVDIAFPSNFQPNDFLLAGIHPLSMTDQAIFPVSPDWLHQADGYQLPAWFDGQRVQLHIRLTRNMFRRNPDLFDNVSAQFKAMGAQVITRHIKTGQEGAWWPSAVGAVEDLGRPNLAKEIIDDAHRQGLHIIIYYRHIEDAWAAEHHPDWHCLSADGTPIEAKRGINLCLNSPYADFILQRQLELVELGADGFYYDSVHMPRGGCWCANCRAKFTQLTGQQHPTAADPADPRFQLLLAFNNDTMARTFLHWRQALHARKPDLVMLIGSNLWPSTNDAHHTHRIFRIADAHKTEYDKGMSFRSRAILYPFPRNMRPMDIDVRLALGWILARDATDGRPPHIWTPGIVSEAHATGSAAAMLTHGAVANLDVKESNLPDLRYRPAFDMGAKVSPHLAGTQPWRWAAVLHSELTRDAYAADNRLMWRKVLYPLYGAFHVLLRRRLPTGFILDSQLEEGRLEGIRLLFVPDDSQLTAPMRQALQRFERDGGLLVVNRPEWGWQLEQRWPAAVAAFEDAIKSTIAAAPVQADGGPEGLQLSAYTDAARRRLIVCLTNEIGWTWVAAKGLEGADDAPAGPQQRRAGAAGDDDDGEADETAAQVQVQPPPPCRQVSLVLRTPETPRQVIEAISGQTLTPTGRAGDWRLVLPPFAYMACVAVQF